MSVGCSELRRALYKALRGTPGKKKKKTLSLGVWAGFPLEPGQRHVQRAEGRQDAISALCGIQVA